MLPVIVPKYPVDQGNPVERAFHVPGTSEVPGTLVPHIHD